jgi:phage baseplate assembly protein gpV
MKRVLGTFTLAVAAMAPLSASADQWNKHWSVGAKPELRIHAGDAAVTVIGTDGNSIDATLTTRGWAIGSGGVEVTEHQMDNFVEIDLKLPHIRWDFGSRQIRLEVRVPHEMTGDIHTGDGSIDLRSLRGSLRVNTGDGSIHGDNLDGSLDAQSGDGSVHIEGRFDDVRLHTQDGSVELRADQGSRLRSDWHVETGDGSVQVRVPHDLSATVDLHTGDGSISFDGPSLSVSGAQSEHQVHGKLNGGGPLLAIHTGDGSISFGS